MFNGFDISASGMGAQRLRMDIIAGNIANIDTTRSEDGGPYRRKLPIFKERDGSLFSSILKNKTGQGGKGVEVSSIVEDSSPFKIVYNPSHPDANEDGLVALPNINLVNEMVDMIDASRAYEANVTAFNTLKSMAAKALEIGRG